MGKQAGCSVRVFIQARMSSQRFPGKVLAPFRQEPIVRQVVRAATAAAGSESAVVLTSDEPSDDPLAAYLTTIGTPVFRGSLNNVFDRFRQALAHWPCDRFVRICADSPLLSADLLKSAIAWAQDWPVDLVSNVFPRSFPKGQSLEIARAATFLAINPRELTEHDREHVMPIFYRNPDRYSIINLFSADAGLAEQSMTIDTLDDLYRLEPDQSLAALDLRIDRAEPVLRPCS